MKLLVTGARGYIGAHISKMLKEAGHTVIATDLPDVDGNDIRAYVDHFYAWDINHTPPESITQHLDVDVVIHMAALISVEESVANPSCYYQTNVFGTLNVIQTFPDHKFVFASTGAAFLPISPYARSKVAAEDIVKEKCAAYTIFRFYNVAGSTGFRSYNEPTHLMRRAAMVARGDIPEIAIYGTDYDTKDGTCIRDYVHVADIAKAVCHAAKKPAAMTDYECLGSGKSYTVREVIDTMREVSGKHFTVRNEDRRQGDTVEVRVPALSPFITPSHTLADMCMSALRYL